MQDGSHLVIDHLASNRRDALVLAVQLRLRPKSPQQAQGGLDVTSFSDTRLHQWTFSAILTKLPSTSNIFRREGSLLYA